jgi:hypothetical protein
MGPTLILSEVDDGYEWAQCCSEENLLKTLNGPKKDLQALEKLPMVLNWPSVTDKQKC